MNKQESKKRKMTGTMKKKLAGLFVLILLAFVFLIIGITIINAKSGDKYTKQVLAQSQQQYDSTTIPYKRGDILDRSGNILATSIKVYNVILDCQVVNSREVSRSLQNRRCPNIWGSMRTPWKNCLPVKRQKTVLTRS